MKGGQLRTWPTRAAGSTWNNHPETVAGGKKPDLVPGRTLRRHALRYSWVASSDRETQTAPIEMPDWFRILRPVEAT